MRLDAIQELASVDAPYVVVSSPARLTEETLQELAKLSVSTGRYPGVGIITGRTMATARAPFGSVVPKLRLAPGTSPAPPTSTRDWRKPPSGN